MAAIPTSLNVSVFTVAEMGATDVETLLFLLEDAWQETKKR